MPDPASHGAVPGWILAAFDPARAASVRSPGSHLADGLAATHGSITLTHVSQQLLAYWHWARGGKAMPAAGDIRPPDMRELLPYVRYLCWESPEVLRFRVFGGALTEAMGADLTGLNLLDLFTPDQREVETRRLTVLHDHPCGIVMRRRFHALSGDSHLIEMVNLPVAPGADGQARVLGAVMACEPPEQWRIAYDRTRPMEHVDAAAIDLGAGVPEIV